MSIVVENLTVSYRTRPAVHHVGIEFAEHSMWAICGPNGAGKSTFLKAVMGLQQVDTGRVLLQNLQRKDIAYLPQQSDIDRGQPMTVFELAAMGLWYEIGFFGRVNAAQRTRVLDALARVGMRDFADRQIAHLSNGQFQRVLFARMLAQGAKFLLLDEPFAGIDPIAVADIKAMIGLLSKRGIGILITDHNVRDTLEITTRAIIVSSGQIMIQGSREEILASPLAREVYLGKDFSM